MTTTLSTIKIRYLERVSSGLADLPEEDREEVLQDLRAHLAEVNENQVEEALGSPDEFVAEFRSSAGLDQGAKRTPRWSLRATRGRIEQASLRLAEVARWQTIRPVWIWTRGWLLVSTIAALGGGTAFFRFPIPSIQESTALGLAVVAAATWLSVWLDGRSTAVFEFGSFLYSAVVAVLFAASVVVSPDLSQTVIFDDEPFYSDQLIAPDGETITNIYAYDLEGNPVEVLLFDQNGRPLRSLPVWVYEEAERNPSFHDPLDYGGGAVSFPRDEFGRIIPNLYPLDLYQYGEYGLEPMPPPSLGFPQTAETASERDNGVVTTTIPGPLD